MNFKDIKKEARKSLKYHFFTSVLVCFVVTLIISNGYKFNTAKQIDNETISNSITMNVLDTNNLNTIENFIKNTNAYSNVLKVTNYKPTRGVLSVFFNQITGSGSIVIGVLNANNQFFFRNSISSLIIMTIGIFIYFLIFVFVQNVIIVGKNRYFLEHRKYRNTPFDKILFVYRLNKTKNVAYIMLKKEIYTILWSLTIIWGIVKHYEYKMIPYILAENPEIDSKDCFKLSKDMTNGYKFTMFKLDLSLILWYLLSYITLGLSNIFYFNPYKESINANVYMILREKIYSKNKKYFKDEYLDGESQAWEYPTGLYFLKEAHHKKWLKINSENISYSIENLVLFFFTFSMFGFLWEVLITFFTEGLIVNRGTMHGPWLPIYGWGGLLITVLLQRFKKRPFVLFTASLVTCGIVEYFTGLYLEVVLKLKWWDYSGYFLNLHGRICLEGLLVFGLLGCIFTYLLVPYLNRFYNKINKKLKIVLVVILVSCYIVDFIYTQKVPNTGKGVSIQLKKDVNKNK